MPQFGRDSKQKSFDLATAQQLHRQGVPYRQIAKQLGTSYGTLYRTLKAISANGDVPAPVEHSAEAVQSSVTQHSADAVSNSAETLADHESRLQVLEAYIASLQAHAAQAPTITVQSSAEPRYALPSAATVQTWEDPEDAKPKRWNLWLPRGLKRRIEAQAKAAGIAPSQLITRLLMATISEGVPRA